MEEVGGGGAHVGWVEGGGCPSMWVVDITQVSIMLR